MADDEEREEQRRQEMLKLYFEFFKHFTTLGTAVGVVILAIYREGIAKQTLLPGALVLFGVAVLLSAFGMWEVLHRFTRGAEAGRLTDFLEILVIGMFGAALIGFIYEALGIPDWILVRIVGPVIIILLCIRIGVREVREFRRRRSSR